MQLINIKKTNESCNQENENYTILNESYIRMSTSNYVTWNGSSDGCKLYQHIWKLHKECKSLQVRTTTPRMQTPLQNNHWQCCRWANKIKYIKVYTKYVHGYDLN